MPQFIHKKKLLFCFLLPALILLVTYLCTGRITQRMLETDNGQTLQLMVRTSPLVRRIDLRNDSQDMVLTVRDTPFFKQAVLILGDQKRVSYLDMKKNKLYVEACTIENGTYCVDADFYTISREEAKQDYLLSHAISVWGGKGDFFAFPE